MFAVGLGNALLIREPNPRSYGAYAERKGSSVYLSATEPGLDLGRPGLNSPFLLAMWANHVWACTVASQRLGSPQLLTDDASRERDRNHRN